jgi:Domain of unknown function (DUF4159)
MRRLGSPHILAVAIGAAALAAAAWLIGPSSPASTSGAQGVHARGAAPASGGDARVPSVVKGTGAARAAVAHVRARRNIPYNGRFTFTRIRYNNRGGGAFGRRGWSNAWNHDWPDADLNMQVMLSEFTAVRPNLGDSNVLDLEDPEIFRYPILYMSEPGYWSITQEGAANLRQHLLKGGLIIFDDFEADQWYNFADQLKRALPEYEFIEIDGTHPVFQSFFNIDDIYVPHPLVAVTPKYFGMFEDNDPRQRMLALVNYNSDLAEYWEWSGQGFFPVDPTTEAYKLGVNYIIYALTH